MLRVLARTSLLGDMRNMTNKYKHRTYACSTCIVRVRRLLYRAAVQTVCQLFVRVPREQHRRYGWNWNPSHGTAYCDNKNHLREWLTPCGPHARCHVAKVRPAQFQVKRARRISVKSLLVYEHRYRVRRCGCPVQALKLCWHGTDGDSVIMANVKLWTESIQNIALSISWPDKVQLRTLTCNKHRSWNRTRINYKVQRRSHKCSTIPVWLFRCDWEKHNRPDMTTHFFGQWGKRAEMPEIKSYLYHSATDSTCSLWFMGQENKITCVVCPTTLHARLRSTDKIITANR